jgi:hypothetical protein
MLKKTKKPWKQLSMKFDQYNKDCNDEQIKTIILDRGLETRFTWSQYPPIKLGEQDV